MNSGNNWHDVMDELTEREWPLVRHDYGRKLTQWPDPVALSTVKIPSITYDRLKKIDLDPSTSPSDDLPEEVSGGIFIARVGGSEYLVNCEGFEYCRYVAGVKVV